MNFFIYGARRSGKTTKLEEIVSMFPDLPIVADMSMSYIKVNHLPANIRRRIKSTEKGLRDYIRICDNVDTVKGEISLEGTHVILTATPDNNKDNIQTRAYSLFECAVSHGWSIISLGIPNPCIDRSEMCDELKVDLPEKYHLGSVEGKWYTQEMLEAEKVENALYRLLTINKL